MLIQIITEKSQMNCKNCSTFIQQIIYDIRVLILLIGFGFTDRTVKENKFLHDQKLHIIF